ncbi:subgroup IIIi aminotransferase, putative [Aspergillus fumigatus Z5]|nr:subgroup IIIi aminotransferase, putative [Aspergillus fumigatus Z5]
MATSCETRISDDRYHAFPPAPANIECRFNASSKTWTAPEVVNDPYIRVHGLSPGLNYGQQVYEGLKAFRTPQNTIHIFRPHAHAARFRKSAKMVCLPEVPDNLFCECLRMAVVYNAEFVPPESSEGFLYIRPLLFGSGPQLILGPPNEFVLAIYVAPAVPYHGIIALEALVMDEFDRSAPRGTGSGKIGGNYAPVWPYQEAAKQSGFGITLHLDSQTRTLIEEFSTSAFVGVDSSYTLYVPDSPNAIKSVTSDSLATIAESNKWKVCREKIPFKDIGQFTEVYAVGTAATAVPIRSIFRARTGEKYTFETEASKQTGRQLVDELIKIQRGLQVDLFEWCWVVA